MGTHPIFESDFDCLTEHGKCGANVHGDTASHTDLHNALLNHQCWRPIKLPDALSALLQLSINHEGRSVAIGHKLLLRWTNRPAFLFSSPVFVSPRALLGRGQF